MDEKNDGVLSQYWKEVYSPAGNNLIEIILSQVILISKFKEWRKLYEWADSLPTMLETYKSKQKDTLKKLKRQIIYLAIT